MPDQGTTPGLKEPPIEEDARRLAELDEPTDPDRELDTALGLMRAAVVTLRAAGDHLRRATAGLPETPLGEGQSYRYGALLNGAAEALRAIDKAIDAVAP